MNGAVRALTCREIADFLADYFAGELGADDRSRFEEHLAECPDCVAYLRSYADAIRLAREACAEAHDPAPASVPERLVQAILAARRRPPRRPAPPSIGRRRRH